MPAKRKRAARPTAARPTEERREWTREDCARTVRDATGLAVVAIPEDMLTDAARLEGDSAAWSALLEGQGLAWELQTPVALALMDRFAAGERLALRAGAAERLACLDRAIADGLFASTFALRMLRDTTGFVDGLELEDEDRRFASESRAEAAAVRTAAQSAVDRLLQLRIRFGREWGVAVNPPPPRGRGRPAQLRLRLAVEKLRAVSAPRTGKRLSDTQIGFILAAVGALLYPAESFPRLSPERLRQLVRGAARAQLPEGLAAARVVKK